MALKNSVHTTSLPGLFSLYMWEGGKEKAAWDGSWDEVVVHADFGEGNLSNDDGDSDENVTSKRNFSFL